MRSTSPPATELLDLVDDETLATDDAALAHVEDLHGSFEIVVGETDHIDVLAALGNHLLLLDRPTHGGEPIANTRGALVLQVLGGGAHLGLEPLDDLVGVAFEEVAQLVTNCRYSGSLDLTDARPAALLDVEQQARPAEPLMLVELARTARADREAAQQQVERVADRVGVRVRPEVPGALALATAHHQRPGELLVDRDRQERIALVVAEPDVEPRPVLLDEAVLEHQRLDLVAHLDPLHRLRRRHHLRGPRMHVARVLEVVREALAQARRLADVDHAARARP